MCSDLHAGGGWRKVMKENELFHLNVTKFAGELDIAYAIFRKGVVEATIRQMEIAKNAYDLPVDEDLSTKIEITSLRVLNAQEGKIRLEGGAYPCVDGRWYGRHCYSFVFVIDMKSRSGQGAFCR